MSEHICMFGIPFSRHTLSSATKAIIKHAKEKQQTSLVATANVDFIITAKSDPDFHKILKQAALITADGMPLVWLSKIMPDKRIPERVTGTGLLLSICAAAANSNLSVAFVGALPGVAEKAKEKLVALNPQLNVVATHCPPFGFENNTTQSMEIIEICRTTKPDILFFGVGCPKQEKWCDKYLDQLNTGSVICVGGAFSFAAGTINRAPRWMRMSGLEWLHRLVQEPGRLWKRYLIKDSLFIFYAAQELCKAWCNRISQYRK